jgi:hypothetical protein
MSKSTRAHMKGGARPQGAHLRGQTDRGSCQTKAKDTKKGKHKRSMRRYSPSNQKGKQKCPQVCGHADERARGHRHDLGMNGQVGRQVGGVRTDECWRKKPEIVGA